MTQVKTEEWSSFWPSVQRRFGSMNINCLIILLKSQCLNSVCAIKHWSTFGTSTKRNVLLRVLMAAPNPYGCSESLWLLRILLAAPSAFGCSECFWLLQVLMAAPSPYGCSKCFWLLRVLMVAPSPYGCSECFWLLRVLMAAPSAFGCSECFWLRRVLLAAPGAFGCYECFWLLQVLHPSFLGRPVQLQTIPSSLEAFSHAFFYCTQTL